MNPLRRLDIRQLGKSLLVVYLVLAAANAVFYLMATRPRGAELAALTVRSAPRLQALRHRTAQVEDLEAYLAALEQATLDLERLRNDVLSTKRKRLTEVQLELARLTTQFNIQLDQVNYDNEELPNEGLERFVMIVPLEGGYRNLRKFVQAVENSDKFLVVERVALGQGKEGGVLLQLNITLATYFNAPQSRERALRRPRPARRG